MCVLCWQFLGEGHWTEQVFEAEGNAAPGTVGSTRERARRRDRYQRTRILNQILRHYGLRLDDWHSRSYVLSDRKGSTVLVRDLGEIWPAAQQLARRRLDPLEPQFLAALGQPDATREPAP
jgi:hypothetical protein